MKRILVVDDSATARMFTTRCVEITLHDELEMQEAADGKEALDKLKADPFDLVITDLNMPVMDGLELVRRIHASPRLHGIPMIVISSSANPETSQQLMELGTASVCEKPLSPMKLKDALDKIDEFREDSPW